jgi:hypothetical protein
MKTSIPLSPSYGSTMATTEVRSRCLSSDDGCVFSPMMIDACSTPIDTTTVSLPIWKCFYISATPKIEGDNRDTRVIPCFASRLGVIYPQNDNIYLRHQRHQRDTPIDTTTVSLAIWKCFDISATPKIEGDIRDRVIPCLASRLGVIYPQNDYIYLRHQHDTPIDTTTVSLAIWKCFDISATPKIEGDNRDRVIPCLATRLGVLSPETNTSGFAWISHRAKSTITPLITLTIIFSIVLRAHLPSSTLS